VNGHHGNQYLRELAMARKLQFDAGNYSDKRTLATEIVKLIHGLQPPGRFLRLVKTNAECNNKQDIEGCIVETPSVESKWEEVDLDKAINKACQVMRDIDRQDRKHRIDRKIARMNRLQLLNVTMTNNSNNNRHNDDRNHNEINQHNSRSDVGNDNILQQHEVDQQEEVDSTINAIVNVVDDDIDVGIDDNLHERCFAPAEHL
jgi:hypothetical protein